MYCRRDKKAFSLLEVLFASFLLLTALSLTVYLIHQSFQSEADSGLKIRALYDAQNAMEEIRIQAYQDFANGLAAVDGKLWPCSVPDYVVESKVAWQPLDLPCSKLENQYDPGRNLPQLGRKILTRSTWKVDVEVRKKDNADTLLHLTTLLTDLAPDNFDLRMVAQDGLTASPEGELNFRAVAYDSANNVLEDLILTWYVEPINSFGSIHVMRRDGWECIYKNRYQDYGNRFTTTPGLCRIVVRGEYQGRVKYASMEITNQ